MEMTENVTEKTSWNILDRRDEIVSCNIKMVLVEWLLVKLASCPLEHFEVFSFRAASAELLAISYVKEITCDRILPWNKSQLHENFAAETASINIHDSKSSSTSQAAELISQLFLQADRSLINQPS